MSEQIKLYEKEQVENQVEIKESDFNILDIGCRDMPFPLTVKLGKSIDFRKTHYVGIDIDEAKLKEGRNWLQGRGEENLRRPSKIDFIVCDSRNLPFKRRSFDTVVFRNFLGDSKIFDNPIDEAYRVLKDGGKLVIMETYTPKNAKELLEIPGFMGENRFIKKENKYNNRDIDKDPDAFVLTFEKLKEKDEKTA